MSDNRHEMSTDLDWLAFRYVAGELGDDEAAAFEQRLAEDQTARDAVAAAVELLQCVMVAERQTTGLNPHLALSPPRRLFDQRENAGAAPQTEKVYPAPFARKPSWSSLCAAGWIAASVAAMLLVMSMTHSVRVERAADLPGSQVPTGGSWSLAARWSDLRERAADIWDEPAAAWRDSNDVAAWQESAGDEADDLLSPDWLLAALADEEVPSPDPPSVME